MSNRRTFECAKGVDATCPTSHDRQCLVASWFGDSRSGCRRCDSLGVHESWSHQSERHSRTERFSHCDTLNCARRCASTSTATAASTDHTERSHLYHLSSIIYATNGCTMLFHQLLRRMYQTGTCGKLKEHQTPGTHFIPSYSSSDMYSVVSFSFSSDGSIMSSLS